MPELEARLGADAQRPISTPDFDDAMHAVMAADQSDLGGSSRSRRWPSRTRLAGAAAVAASIAATVALAVSLTASGGQDNRSSGTGNAALADGGGGYRSQPAGALVHGEGMVVITRGRPARFCPSEAAALPAGVVLRPLPGSGPLCKVGVTVTGLDPAQLTARHVDGDVTYGYASLTGHLAGGRLVVTRQSAYQGVDTTPTPQVPPTPPCAAPAGGWPRRPVEDLDLSAAHRYAARHKAAIVYVGVLRPSLHQVLAFVLTNGDPNPVRTALRHTYGERLCVTQSAYSAWQIRSAYLAFKAHLGSTLTSVRSVDQEISASNQPVILVRLYTPNSQLTRLAASFPAGLVEIDPWLRPR